MRARFAVFLLVSSIALLGGCSSPDTSGGPEQVVHEFYQHLNSGDYDRAMSYYGKEARAIFEDPATASDSGFSRWARKETKEGRVDEVEVTRSTPSEDQTTTALEYEIVYSDGTRASRSVTLSHKNGEWKLGLIG